MYFVYVIKSKKDGQFYTGFTDDLERRLLGHNQGLQESTKNRIPFELIYFEWCIDKQDALNREKYLKSGWGKRYLKIRLRNYLT
ncbi:MAG: GIY-YIG nuclease family protein [Candidatus Omnitrophota bacterium]